MSRVLSVLSIFLCRQHRACCSIYANRWSASRWLVIKRCSRTHAATAKSRKVAAKAPGGPARVTADTACSDTDPSITVFHRPTKLSVDYSDISDSAGSSSVHCKWRGEAVDITFTKNVKESLHNVQQQIREDRLDTSSIKLQSIDELLTKELKPRHEQMSLISLYAKLAKSRLTGLVVCTAIAGYVMAPGPFSLSSLLLCCIGTGLTSASANAINQVFEVPYDSQMLRTRSRPLVKVLVSPLHAVNYAAVTGLAGVLTLSAGVGSLPALLAMLNVVLYTAVYTPIKRLSVHNTAVGAVVGAIPPMIGWASATGTLDIGAWLLAGIMYSWQFPHFHALSWNLRADYSRAGYRMMSVVEPDVCRRTSLQYSLVLAAVCLAMPYCDVTTWTFAVDSLPFNVYLLYLSYQFYRRADSNSSRRLFHYTLIHLPALLILMFISKKHFTGSVTHPAPRATDPAASLDSVRHV